MGAHVGEWTDVDGQVDRASLAFRTLEAEFVGRVVGPKKRNAAAAGAAIDGDVGWQKMPH